MDIENIYKKFIEECGGEISTDTRNIKDGSMFFAWKGEYDDGNKYAEEALRLGCKYAIVDNKDYVLNDNYILVNSSIDTLGELVHFHRSMFTIPIIAITGSNGKTTTKELVTSVLKTEKKVVAPDKSFNNQIGVSKTLLQITKNTEIVVIEMGANHIGEIAQLCEIASPTHGVVTNIGRAHLGLFGGFDGVIRAKMELYEYLEKHDGTVFINSSDELLLSKLHTDKKITYLSSDSDYPVVSNKTLPLFSLTWKDYCIQTNLTGEYNLPNVAVAIAIGSYFNISDDNIIRGIEGYTPNNARSEIIETEKGNIIIKDYYNANRNSMELALDNLSSISLEKKKIAILGDMKELGDFETEEHIAVAKKAIELGIDTLIFIGDVFSRIKIQGDNVFQYKTIDEVIDFLKNINIQNSVVLLKSSRGPNPIPAFQKIFDSIDW